MKKNWFLFFGIIFGLVSISLAAVNKPTAVIPLDGTVTNSQNLIFIWTGISEATTYYLQVSTDITFSNLTSTGVSTSLIISTATLAPATTSFTAITPLNQNIFYWRVSADSVTVDSFSGWSSTSSVIVDTAPPLAVDTLIGPLHNFTTNQMTVQFSWVGSTDTPAGIKNYILQISTANDFSLINCSSVTKNTSAALSLNQSSYTWRVNIEDNATNYTTSTLHWTLIIDTAPPGTPIPVSPVNNISTNSQTGIFVWSEVSDSGFAGLQDYTLQLSTDNFLTLSRSSTTVLSTAAISGISHSTYSWRVIATDYANNKATSTAWNIEIDTIAPAQVVVYSTGAWRRITSTWTAPGDDGNNGGITNGKYQVRYSTNSDFSLAVTTISFSTTAAQGSLETYVSTGLANGLVWYFQLRTQDEVEGNWSPWSYTSTAAAVNSVPYGITLSTPIDNNFESLDKTPLFNWTDATEPDTIYGDAISSYTVVYSKDNFATSSSSGGLKISEFIPSADLVENSTYRWYVLAYDRDSASMQSSTTGQFRLDVLNSAISNFSLVSPTGSIIVTTLTPLLTWQIATDGDPWDTIDYEVQWSSTAFANYHSSAGIKVNYFVPPSSPDSRALVENTTYWWNVKANSQRELDPYNTHTNSQLSNSTATFRVNASSENPNPPVLLWPEDTRILTTQTTTFYWASATDPDPWPENFVSSYTIQIANNPSFSGKYEETVATTSYAVPAVTLTDNNTYWWRVKTWDNTNRDGSFSSSQTIRVDFINSPPNSFSLSSPTSCQVYLSTYPVFFWQANGDSDPWDRVKYTIKYSSDSSFSSYISSTGLTVPSYTAVSALIENATYWWQVIAYDYNPDYSEWATLKGSQTLSAIATFYVNAYEQVPNTFNLLSPTTNQVLNQDTITFSWENNGDPDPGDYITKYKFSFDKIRDFSSNDVVLREPTVSSVTSTISISPFEDTTCYWKVEAYDNRGDPTKSQQNLIRVSNTTGTVRIDRGNVPPGKPNLLLPSEGAIISQSLYVLRWSTVSPNDPWDSVVYRIEYSSSQFNSSVSSTGTFSSFSVSDLTENATYWWRVMAIDYFDLGSGLVSRSTGTVSEIGKFFVNYSTENPNGVFSSTGPVYPTNNQILTVSATTFQWVPAVDPDPGDRINLYKLYWVSCSSVSFDIYVYPPYNNRYSSSSVNSIEIGNLLDNTSYWWAVEAISEISGISSSTVHTVRVDYLNSAPGAFSLVSPGTSTIGALAISTTSTPTFRWQANGDPDPWDKVKYKIEYSTTGTGFLIAVSSDIVYGSTYTPTIPLIENATYYWRVTAIDYNPDVPQWANARGSTTCSGEILIFQVNASSESPGGFSLVSPANGYQFPVEKLSKRPTFYWENAVDPNPGDKVDHYELYIASSVSFSESSFYFSSLAVKSLSLLMPIDLKENATYWWKVLAVNGTGLKTPSATWYFHIPVINCLKEPSGVKGERETSQFILSWSTVTKNTDESIADDLAGYNVYRATDISIITAVPVSTFTTAITWTDTPSTTFYYLVRAMDTSGIESKDSMIVDSNPQGNIVIQDENKEVDIIIPKEVSDTLYKENNLQSDLKITVDKSTGTVGTGTSQQTVFIYDLKTIKVEDNQEVPGFSFSQPVEIKFNYGAAAQKAARFSPSFSSSFGASDYAILWHNQVEYVNLSGKVDTQAKTISVKSKEIGKYRVQQVLRATAFELRLTRQRIFTPNSDGINDLFKFNYDNPKVSKVTGEVYDITGAFIADLEVSQDENYLSWDGKDNDGNLCRDGVYIYQIKAEGETFGGTVILAK